MYVMYVFGGDFELTVGNFQNSELTTKKKNQRIASHRLKNADIISKNEVRNVAHRES